LRSERDQGGQPEHHVMGVPPLPLDAVHATAHLELRESDLLERDHAWTQRAERVEPLGAGPLLLAPLQVAGGDVVQTGDARQRGERLRLRDPADALADHDGDLRLVLDPCRLGWQHDRVAVPDDCRGRLEEEQRLLGNDIAELRRVLAVVASHAHDLSRPRDGHLPGPVLVVLYGARRRAAARRCAR